MWLAEDNLADTVVPRLIAAGADVDRIACRTFKQGPDGGREPVSLDDAAHLRSDIASVGAGLVIIDPLVAFVPSDTNANSDHQVRRALMPLVDACSEMGVACLGVRHFHKGLKANVVHAGGGSIGFAGLVRSILQVGRDLDDSEGETFVLAVAKKNLTKGAVSLAYRIVPDGEVGRIQWLGESSLTAQSLLAGERTIPRRQRRDESVAWLANALDAGPAPAAELLRQGEDAGFSDKRLRAALGELGGRARREGFGPGSAVLWRLGVEEDP